MGGIAISDITRRSAVHLYLTDIHEVVVVPLTASARCQQRGACIRVGQQNFTFACHLPCERCILWTTVNLERLVEHVVKHGQGHIARMVCLGLHHYHGAVEGFPLLRHVLIVELLMPQANQTLFHFLLAGHSGIALFVTA